MNVTSQTAIACYTADWLDRYSIATLPNPNGNRSGNQTHLGATTSSTVTANNQISTDSVYNYTWDFEGNMTSRTSIATGDKEEFSYDHRIVVTPANRLPRGWSVTNRTVQPSWEARGD